MPILSSFDVLVTLPADIVLNYTSLASRLLVVVTFCNRVINALNSLMLLFPLVLLLHLNVIFKLLIFLLYRIAIWFGLYV